MPTTSATSTNHQQQNNFYNNNNFLPLHLGDRQESHVQADVERLRCDPRQRPVEEQCDQSGNKLKLKLKTKSTQTFIERNKLFKVSQKLRSIFTMIF